MPTGFPGLHINMGMSSLMWSNVPYYGGASARDVVSTGLGHASVLLHLVDVRNSCLRNTAEILPGLIVIYTRT